MARRPNSMRNTKVASAAKPKKKRNSPIPKDVNKTYMTASRKTKSRRA